MATARSTIATVAATENLWADYRRTLGGYADRIATKEEVTGVVILGGLADGGARMFADEVSDLDIAMVLSLDLPDELLGLEFPAFAEAVQPHLPAWLPNFKFRVPRGDGGPIDIDTHQLVLEYESQPHVAWNLAKLEAYGETAEIVYDPTGRVRALIDAKVAAGRGLLRDLVITTVAMGHVLGEGAVERSLIRGLPIEAHDVLTALLADAVVAIYACNDRFPPDRKWRVTCVDDLGWRPAHAVERIGEAMLVREHSAEDVRRRQALVVSLVHDLRDHCVRELDWFPEDPYTHAVTHIYPDRQLRRGTAADTAVAPLAEQYAKMDDDAWNSVNWSLAAGPRALG